MVGRSSYVAPRWSAASLAPRGGRCRRRRRSRRRPRRRRAAGHVAQPVPQRVDDQASRHPRRAAFDEGQQGGLSPLPAFQRAGVKSAAAGTIKWRDSGPLDQADLNRLISDVSKVPGADARTPVVAVSRHGVTAAGAAATLGPEDLLAAWAAKRPG